MLQIISLNLASVASKEKFYYITHFITKWNCNSTTNILNFKYLQAKISQLENVSSEEFVLSCEGTILEGSTCVSALHCFELDFTVPLLGGKVHGSLARAGKYNLFKFDLFFMWNET